MPAKFQDYEIMTVVNDMMEDIVSKYPTVFEGFDSNKVLVVFTKGKKSKTAAKLHPVKYPYSTMIDKTYILEIYYEKWKDMPNKSRNLSLFHHMCSVPEGGFDESSKNYAGKRKPDYKMFAEEFAVTGGVPNWEENPEARDVFDEDVEENDVVKVPVTPEGIAS